MKNKLRIRKHINGINLQHVVDFVYVLIVSYNLSYMMQYLFDGTEEMNVYVLQILLFAYLAIMVLMYYSVKDFKFNELNFYKMMGLTNNQLYSECIFGHKGLFMFAGLIGITLQAYLFQSLIVGVVMFVIIYNCLYMIVYAANLLVSRQKKLARILRNMYFVLLTIIIIDLLNIHRSNTFYTIAHYIDKVYRHWNMDPKVTLLGVILLVTYRMVAMIIIKKNTLVLEEIPPQKGHKTNWTKDLLFRKFHRGPFSIMMINMMILYRSKDFLFVKIASILTFIGLVCFSNDFRLIWLVGYALIYMSCTLMIYLYRNEVYNVLMYRQVPYRFIYFLVNNYLVTILCTMPTLIGIAAIKCYVAGVGWNLVIQFIIVGLVLNIYFNCLLSYIVLTKGRALFSKLYDLLIIVMGLVAFFKPIALVLSVYYFVKVRKIWHKEISHTKRR